MLGQLFRTLGTPLHALGLPFRVLGQPLHALGVPFRVLGLPLYALGLPFYALGRPLHTLGLPLHTLGVPLHAPRRAIPSPCHAFDALGQDNRTLGFSARSVSAWGVFLSLSIFLFFPRNGGQGVRRLLKGGGRGRGRVRLCGGDHFQHIRRSYRKAAGSQSSITRHAVPRAPASSPRREGRKLGRRLFSRGMIVAIRSTISPQNFAPNAVSGPCSR